MEERIYDDSAPGRDLNAISAKILSTDVDTGLTFARIAQNSSDTKKKSRNQANARKAYDSVTYYEKRLQLSNVEKLVLAEKLHRLKAALVRLGEEF